MRLAGTIPAALGVSILLAASAPADAATVKAPTGKVRTWQAAAQGRIAMHGAMSWTVDKNPGEVDVSIWLQHARRHGIGPIHWTTWDRRGPAPQQSSTANSGGLSTHAKCLTGRWRVHVDTLAVVIIHGPAPTTYPVHVTHNSRVITVRKCP